MELRPKARILLERGKDILRENGLFYLIQRAFLFFIGYQTYYVFEKDLNELSTADFTPKIQDFTLKIITASRQIDELVAHGFDFSSAPNIVNFNPKRKLKEVSIENFNFRQKLGEEGILFCGFVNKVLAHTNWAAMSNKTNMDPYLVNKIDWRNEVIVGPSNTNPGYRGLGIKTYVRSQMYQFLKEKGRSKARGTTGKNNIAMHKSEARLGSRIVAEGRQFRILWWKFSIAKPTKGVRQWPRMWACL